MIQTRQTSINTHDKLLDCANDQIERSIGGVCAFRTKNRLSCCTIIIEERNSWTVVYLFATTISSSSILTSWTVTHKLCLTDINKCTYMLIFSYVCKDKSSLTCRTHSLLWLWIYGELELVHKSTECLPNSILKWNSSYEWWYECCCCFWKEWTSVQREKRRRRRRRGTNSC